MKLYRADLVAVDHRIPYFDKKCLFIKGIGNYIANYYQLNYYKEDSLYSLYETSIYQLFHLCMQLVVRKKIHTVEDSITGISFPQIQFKNGYIFHFSERTIPDKCQLYQPNRRLYVRIRSELDSNEIQNFYHSFNSMAVQKRKEEIEKWIEKEQRYWNPLPEVGKWEEEDPNYCKPFLETAYGSKQYVKMIEQMRKQNGNN